MLCFAQVCTFHHLLRSFCFPHKNACYQYWAHSWARLGRSEFREKMRSIQSDLMLLQSLLNYVGSSHWYKWGLDQKIQEEKRRKKEMPPKQAEEVKTMLTSLILIRGRWWCPVELPPVGQNSLGRQGLFHVSQAGGLSMTLITQEGHCLWIILVPQVLISHRLDKSWVEKKL